MAGRRQHYAATTHAADLAAFLRQLNTGPVHLIGLSYGGTVAALVAVAHPEMLRSLTLAEPGLGTLLADIPEAKPALEEWMQARQSLLAAVKAGEVTRAVKLFFELVNHQGADTFEKQPDLVRQIFLDNARTVPLALAAPPPSITCAMLRSVAVPTLVVGGAQTLPFFALVNEVAVRCIPSSRSVSIPLATHPMSYQNPVAFNEALLQFLAQH